MKNITLFVLLTFCIVTGCNKDDNAPDNLFKSYDRQSMLSTIGTNIIALYQDFYNNSDSLLAACGRFTSEPSDKNLLMSQSSWVRTSAAWQRCELYNFGPVETLQLRGAIDTWPLKGSDIESAMNTDVPIDNNYIQSKSVRVKGLKALEYLLFNSTTGNNIIVDQYINGTLVLQRKAYLIATAQNLSNKAAALLDAWKPSEGNFLQNFISADGNDVSSSIGLLVNVIATHTDDIKNLKLGIPLGKISGAAAPEQVESFHSGTSLQNIKDNILTLQNTILGKSPSGFDGPGLDDLLDHLGSKYNDRSLTTEINARFKNVNDKLNAINGSLSEAVINNPQQVEAAYTAMKDLLVILKGDLVNNLGVLLTFTDNDGD